MKNKTKADDMDAVRAVVEALEPFGEVDRQRIVRWAEEKLKIMCAADLAGVVEGLPVETATTKKPRRKKAAVEKTENGTERPAGTQDDI